MPEPLFLHMHGQGDTPHSLRALWSITETTQGHSQSLQTGYCTHQAKLQQIIGFLGGRQFMLKWQTNFKPGYEDSLLYVERQEFIVMWSREAF